MAELAPSAPPKKKLPFKRTIARRKSPDAGANGGTKPKKEDDDDGLDLFRRTEELPDVLREHERRIKEKEQRASASVAIKEDPDSQDAKRRKLSISPDKKSDNDASPSRRSVPRSASRTKSQPSALSDDGDDVIMDVKGKGKAVERRDVLMRENPFQSSRSETIAFDGKDVKTASSPEASRNSPNGVRWTRSQGRPPSPKLEDGIFGNPFASSPPAVKRPPPEDDDDDSDDVEDVLGPTEANDEPEDDFAQYVQAARERAEREAKIKLERESQVKDSQGSKIKGEDDLGVDSQEDISDEVEVKVLVTSALPGSRPMISKRKFKQKLGPILDVWLQLQNPPVMRDDWPKYFLTWGGRRVFRPSTCASLGMSVVGMHKDGKLGRLAVKKSSSNPFENSGLQNGNLHLEAWNQDLWLEHVQRKEKEKLRLLGEIDDEDEKPNPNDLENDDSDGGGGEEEARVRVTLKAAKGYEPVKFTAFAHTTIDQMIAVFRDKRQVPDNQTIWLSFDGEKLDGDLAVVDTEIEDMDSLEVHIK